MERHNVVTVPTVQYAVLEIPQLVLIEQVVLVHGFQIPKMETPLVGHEKQKNMWNIHSTTVELF